MVGACVFADVKTTEQRILIYVYVYYLAERIGKTRLTLSLDDNDYSAVHLLSGHLDENISKCAL